MAGAATATAPPEVPEVPAAAGSAAIDRPEGPETVPEVVREPTRDVDETPIKE